MATKQKKSTQRTNVSAGTGSSTLQDHGVLLHGQEEAKAADPVQRGTGSSTLLDHGVLVHGQDEAPTKS